MRIDRTTRRRFARALRTGGMLLAAMVVLLFAIALLAGALGPDELIAHIAKEVGR